MESVHIRAMALLGKDIKAGRSQSIGVIGIFSQPWAKQLYFTITISGFTYN
jgi:hypothetical protein